MTDPESTERPEAGAGDVAYTIVKATLSAIPVVGGPAAEVFAAIITAPFVRRRDEWIESIAERLKVLEERVEGFKLEDLSQNETFVTTLLHASQVAIRNHQEEKLEALRNAVLNTALPSAPEEDLQHIFVEFVDTFTPWHLRILKFFDDPREWGRQNDITYPNWYAGGPSAVLEHAFPHLRGRRDFYDQLYRDLFIRGLVNTESLHTTMTSEGMFASRTTPLGKQFLGFIASPI